MHSSQSIWSNRRLTFVAPMGVRKFILKIPQPYLRSENYYARKILRPLPRLKLPGMLRCDLGLTPSNLTVANRSDGRDAHDFSPATDRTPPP